MTGRKAGLRKAITLAAVLIGLVVCGLAWVRCMPVSVDAHHRIGTAPHEAGNWHEGTAFEAVRQVPAPKAVLAELIRIGLASPGTSLLEGDADEGLITLVTRSAVLGAPEITNLWIDGDRVHLRGYAIYMLPLTGKRAERRIDEWLARAGL